VFGLLLFVSLKNTIMSNLVKFQGNDIACVQIDGEYYVAIKPISEAIGLRHDSALEGIKSDEILSQLYGVRRMVAGDNKEREMGCLPLAYLNGWLFTIDANKVSEQARAVLLAYKRECYRVLHEHFFGRQEARNRATEVFMELHSKRAYLKGLQKQLADSEVGQAIATAKKEIRTLEVEQASLDHEMFGKQLPLV
jgi:hypothetical protein